MSVHSSTGTSGSVVGLGSGCGSAEGSGSVVGSGSISGSVGTPDGEPSGAELAGAFGEVEDGLGAPVPGGGGPFTGPLAVPGLAGGEANVGVGIVGEEEAVSKPWLSVPSDPLISEEHASTSGDAKSEVVRPKKTDVRIEKGS